MITENITNKFKFDIIIGPANNQLRAASQERDIEIARAGILFVLE